MEAVKKAESETASARATTSRHRRHHGRGLQARRVRESLGAPIIMSDFLTMDLPRTPPSRSVPRQRDAAPLSPALACRHRPPEEPRIHWRVLAKWLRMAADHVHNGTVVGKLEGDRRGTMAINDLLREDFVPPTEPRSVLRSTLGISPSVFLRPPAAFMPGICRTWLPSSATMRLQFVAGRRTIQAQRAGASANRVVSRPCLRHATKAGPYE